MLARIVLVLAVACAFPAVGAQQPASGRKPNIVLILADDLGINDLGCYGRKDHRTPNLDRLAAEGMRFKSAYCAQPICSPSRAAILSGRTPARLHLTTFLPGRPDKPSQKLLHPRIQMALPLEEETLAELLRRAGYASACIGKWHLGGGGFGPGEQGFDVVFPGRANTVPSAVEGGKGEYELTTEAEKFVRENRNRPFFLYLPHNNPHIPLAAKPELLEKNRGAFNPVYAAVVETLDDAVGRLLARLDDLGLRDDTIVIFTSDNGGLHVPEGREDPPTHNTPFRAGKGFVYEGGLRVPLIVRFPGRVKAGTVTSIPVVNTDFMPTLLELVGLRVPTGLDGESFASLLMGKDERTGRTFFWHFPHYTNQGSRPSGAVRQGDWKLVENYDDGRVELYNLARDFGETEDLSAQEPQRTAALKQRLARWRRAVGAQENLPNPSFDPALYKELYQVIDVSRLKPKTRAADMTPHLAAWRRAMNAPARTPER